MEIIPNTFLTIKEKLEVNYKNKKWKNKWRLNNMLNR